MELKNQAFQNRCAIVLFHYYFSLVVSSPKNVYLLLSQNNQQGVVSKIPKITLLYKTWRCYNKFKSMKSLSVCYLYAKMPRWRCVEHGLELEYITFYVQKHLTPLAVCSVSQLVHNVPLGAPLFVRLNDANQALFVCGHSNLSVTCETVVRRKMLCLQSPAVLHPNDISTLVDGNKLLLEPVLTKMYVSILCHQGAMNLLCNFCYSH